MTRTIANEKSDHGHQAKSKSPANAPPTMDLSRSRDLGFPRTDQLVCASWKDGAQTAWPDPEGAQAPKGAETMALRISSGYAEPNMARPFDIDVAGPMLASTRANTNTM
ncbi:hypothetical protein SUNI508_13974 [Seiridium unicorne]|uniref:Uncharacterized protein n=1 Tax=Seiridium unicorne TaxID=138068 RepID=A0ABR2V9U9_9PEZI